MNKDTFQLTKRRSIHGSFTIYDGGHLTDQALSKAIKTNVDPVGHLMGKRNTGVFVVRHDDYVQLSVSEDIATHVYWDEDAGLEVAKGTDKAIAYIESVSQLPYTYMADEMRSRSDEGGAYTSVTHWTEETMRTRFDNIHWFDNAWEGHSWGDENGTPPCFWTKNYTTEGESSHTRMWASYEKQHPGRGWRIGYDVFTTYGMVLSALVDFLNMHVHEVHVWVQGTLEGMGSTELIAKLKGDVDGALAQYMGGRENAQAFWAADVSKSTDVFHYYASRPPQRIPVVPWRACNMGMRMYGGQRPQVFPATTWLRKVLDSYGGGKHPAGSVARLVLNAVRELPDDVVYTNYSGFVKMIPMGKDDALDFAWSEIRPNEYKMVAVGSPPGPCGYLYKIANPGFFMGMGSVATSQHSAFGIGRSEDELYNQTIRMLETGAGTSGHMIASILCHRSHFMWYLEEVYLNLTTKMSIYLMPFNEPAGTEYHAVEEYSNALEDMEKIFDHWAVGRYPRYTLVNFALCRGLVNFFASHT
jgi:hypothetical protein